jgi:hypothetical protein
MCVRRQPGINPVAEGYVTCVGGSVVAMFANVQTAQGGQDRLSAVGDLRVDARRRPQVAEMPGEEWFRVVRPNRSGPRATTPLGSPSSV